MMIDLIFFIFFFFIYFNFFITLRPVEAIPPFPRFLDPSKLFSVTLWKFAPDFSEKTTCAILLPVRTVFLQWWFTNKVWTIPLKLASITPAFTGTKWSFKILERGNNLPKNPVGVAHLKSSEIVSAELGEKVLVSAAYNSYPADPSVAWQGSSANSLSSKYFTVICFDSFK